MVTTNDANLADRIWSWKDHGRNRKLYGKPSNGHYKRVFDTLGTNARMTEVQAAIGREGLKKVYWWIERRQLHAALISGWFRTGAMFYPQRVYYRHYWYAKNKAQRDEILVRARERGVPLGVGSCPEIYLEKVFSSYRPKNRLYWAHWMGNRSIAFLVDPCQSAVSMAAQARIVEDVCPALAS